IMRDGVIEQWATPHQIYHRPVSREVAAFVGSGVFLPGIVRSADAVAVAGTEVSGTVEPAFSAGQQVEVLLRPDDIVEDPAGQAATVQAKSFRGPTIIFELLLENGEQVLASLSADRDYEIGTVLKVAIAPAHLVLFSRRS
ncbi:MAG: TOBE domain-containing protein, partial [Gammaproteobacteria bacterium]|nr:TOBE domain-containing protein [Gammaproteobacteria bacterium]